MNEECSVVSDTAFKSLIQRLEDVLDQVLNRVTFTPEECTGVFSILTELQDLLRNISEEISQKYADYVGSQTQILDMWYKFQSWQFNCKFFKDIFILCVLAMCFVCRYIITEQC